MYILSSRKNTFVDKYRDHNMITINTMIKSCFLDIYFNVLGKRKNKLQVKTNVPREAKTSENGISRKYKQIP